jgi:hypothetical protein
MTSSAEEPTRLAGAGDYVEWLRLSVYEKPIPSTNRARAAAACLALAQQHHSIVLLCEHRLYGSAFALVRVSFEAYVRGEWLISCATDEQVDYFFTAKEPPKLDILIGQIEIQPTFSEGTLSALKARHWKSMCAYTHSGGLHVQRWQTPDGVEPNYSLDEVDEVLLFAEIIGSLAAIATLALSSDENTAELLLKRFKERVK